MADCLKLVRIDKDVIYIAKNIVDLSDGKIKLYHSKQGFKNIPLRELLMHKSNSDELLDNYEKMLCHGSITVNKDSITSIDDIIVHNNIDPKTLHKIHPHDTILIMTKNKDTDKIRFRIVNINRVAVEYNSYKLIYKKDRYNLICTTIADSWSLLGAVNLATLNDAHVINLDDILYMKVLD